MITPPPPKVKSGPATALMLRIETEVFSYKWNPLKFCKCVLTQGHRVALCGKDLGGRGRLVVSNGALAHLFNMGSNEKLGAGRGRVVPKVAQVEGHSKGVLHGVETRGARLGQRLSKCVIMCCPCIGVGRGHGGCPLVLAGNFGGTTKGIEDHCCVLLILACKMQVRGDQRLATQTLPPPVAVLDQLQCVCTKGAVFFASSCTVMGPERDTAMKIER